MKSRVQIESAMQTHVGRVRRENQDAMGMDTERGLFVVCDGMGGAAAGELASRMAVEVFFREAAKTGAAAGESVGDAVITANRELYAYAQDNSRLRGMGTTLVALQCSKQVKGADLPLVIANVGDSRCYRVRDGVMELLTEDHSLVGEHVRMGEMTVEEAAISPMRNVITRAVGTYPDVEVDLLHVDAMSGDMYLLASDGLTRELSEAAIAAILNRRGQRLETAALRLVEASNAVGGADNVTVMLVRVSF